MYSKMQDGSFIIAGYVARDAEMKSTQSGKTLTQWGVAVGSKQGQNGKETIWTNCKAWDKVAEEAAKIRKGDSVFCVGRIEVNDYNGKQYKNLVCEFVVIMDSASAQRYQNAVPSFQCAKQYAQQAAPQQYAQQYQQQQAPQAAPQQIKVDDLGQFEEILSDGEVPF
jgi:single-strand DNA-binding protein